jgi:hypothetical protein
MDGIWTAYPTGRYWRAAAVASTVATLALGAVLLVRRLTGDFALSIAIAQLLPTAAILIAWAWLVRLSFNDCVGVDRLSCADLITREGIFSLWLPLIAVLGFAVALSYPGERYIDWFVWLAALSAVLLGPSPLLNIPYRNRLQRRSESYEIIVQDLKRYRSADGREIVRGTLAAEFAANQRSTTIYSAFCPPFEKLPQVSAHAVRKGASVNVAQALHHGVQLEVRLPSEAKVKQVITVEFAAGEL